VVFVVDDTYSMNAAWSPYRYALTNILSDKMGPFDKAEIITYASPTNNPAGRELIVWPPGDPPPQTGSLTTEIDILIDYLNDGDIRAQSSGAYNYSFVCDAIGFGMDDLSSQGSDEMRALNAVVAFTDSAPPNFLFADWNTGSVVAEASNRNIPIYSIAFASGTSTTDMQTLGLTPPSNFYYPATSSGQFLDAYYQALNQMDAGLRELYSVTWDTAGRSTDEVDVSVRVNYAHTDDFFSDTDIENNYDMP
jgi:hypothetical protein